MLSVGSEAIPGEPRLLPEGESEESREKRAGEERRGTEAGGASGNHPGAVGDDTEPPRSAQGGGRGYI